MRFCEWVRWLQATCVKGAEALGGKKEGARSGSLAAAMNIHANLF